MSPLTRLALLSLATFTLGCSEAGTPVAPDASQDGPAFTLGDFKLSGSGHFSRTIGGLTELTTFAFHANDKSGGTSGTFHYDFRAAGFRVDGTVTCISVDGNQAWVGGVVDRVVSEDPSFQDLLGLDMWWRSIDTGEGASAAPDSTTGLGFQFPGVVITKESWCADQPVALVMRAIEGGNVQLH